MSVISYLCHQGRITNWSINLRKLNFQNWRMSRWWRTNICQKTMFRRRRMCYTNSDNNVSVSAMVKISFVFRAHRCMDKMEIQNTVESRKIFDWSIWRMSIPANGSVIVELTECVFISYHSEFQMHGMSIESVLFFLKTVNRNVRLVLIHISIKWTKIHKTNSEVTFL